jgi:hypothetical protein
MDRGWIGEMEKKFGGIGESIYADWRSRRESESIAASGGLTATI